MLSRNIGLRTYTPNCSNSTDESEHKDRVVAVSEIIVFSEYYENLCSDRQLLRDAAKRNEKAMGAPTTGPTSSLDF